MKCRPIHLRAIDPSCNSSIPRRLCRLVEGALHGFATQEARHSPTNRRRRDRAYLLEATVRYAAELGYEVTVVQDATADYSDEMMHAALDINIPNYASVIVTAEEIVTLISPLCAHEHSHHQDS
jgi:hypothetical protein